MRRVVTPIILALSLAVLVRAAHPAERNTAVQSASPLASIDLYNPTRWTGPVAVELPVGSIAAPGLIDWANCVVAVDGKEIPFSIREGRVHWKARLTAPVTRPRAEDLLVFSIPLPTGRWVRATIVPGIPMAGSALTRASGACVVTYPGIRVVIDERSAMLSGLECSGTTLVAEPLGLDFHAVQAGTIALAGFLGCGYDPPTLAIKHGAKLERPKARLASFSSSPALTELHFAIEPAQGPVLALTYRIHPGGLVEIISDERPWRGRSPWIDHAVRYDLKLAGTRQVLPLLQNRHPFYGFKDYSAPVRFAGTVYRTPQASVLEFGEETLNGRRWARQLYIDAQPEPAKTKGLVEIVSEGLVVRVTPVSTPRLRPGVQVSYPVGSKTAAETLVQALADAGIEARLGVGSAAGGESLVRMQLAAEPELEGLEGDGFAIRRDSRGNGITILAGTRYGLMQAALRVADHLRRNRAAQALPLIAGNPAVDLRCGGFGGGNHEVDFPYGSETEWKSVFDNLIASGMNRMTCMGMWGNWKLPAFYKYMPELRSTAPEAYDEVSGAKFSEFDLHREKGLRLIQYLHDRGVQVWLWVPVGCVPTTFAARYPEAMCKGSQKTPRFMHPRYRQYLGAYFKEILETYPLDGFMLVRDDNGGLDDSVEYRQFLEKSRTKDPAWEQYLLIYDLLRGKGFKGTVMVYPYFDRYEPRLDPLVPEDFLIGGHGSGLGMLTRNYELLAPMGDTWIDNLYTSFRVAPSPRMKRLLADRGSYWIGGAYWGTELPWEAIGYFGWQPTASVNTFRYDWGMRTFGNTARAMDFFSFSSAYENLWDIYNTDLLPCHWQLKMNSRQRTQSAESGRAGLQLYRNRLEKLKNAAPGGPTAALASASPGDGGAKSHGGDGRAAGDLHARWFAQVSLYGTFFEYSLRRLELHSQLFELVTPYQAQIERSQPLPADVRRKVIRVYRELYRSSEAFAAQTRITPGAMMRATEPMTSPYKEWVAGFNGWLEAKLGFKQFAGSMSVSPLQVAAGRPFDLTIELANQGVCPWIPGVGHKLLLEGDSRSLGLPETVDFTGEWVLPGDTRRITLRGTAPATAGQGELKLSFASPFYLYQAVMDRKIPMVWK